MSRKPIVAIDADPFDPDDRSVSREGLDRGIMGRRIRRLRKRLGLSQIQFSERYGIPVANIRQYEIGRTMPPPAVRAYLAVIGEEPDITAKALTRAEAA